jgi:cytochrome c5
MRTVAALALLALAGCQAKDDFAFQNASITLPDDPVTLPAGPGADLVTTNCGACHSPGYILTQPRLKRAQWEATVEKMQKVFKAPIDAKDVPGIVDYLVAVNEKQTPQ